MGLALLTVVAPAANAQTAEAGVAGQCEDGPGSTTPVLPPTGGSDDVAVYVDGTSATVDAPSGSGAAAAVAQLAQGGAGEGTAPFDNCDEPDTNRRDYLMVWAGANGQEASVCYDGTTDVTTNDCNKNPSDDSDTGQLPTCLLGTCDGELVAPQTLP